MFMLVSLSLEVGKPRRHSREHSSVVHSSYVKWEISKHVLSGVDNYNNSELGMRLKFRVTRVYNSQRIELNVQESEWGELLKNLFTK